MALHDRPADRQAEAEADRPSMTARITLLERDEDPRQVGRIKPDPRIAHLDDEPTRRAIDFPRRARLVAGPNCDRATRWAELHGVLDQIPEDLLEPRGVDLDVMRLGDQPDGDGDPGGLDVVAADRHDLADRGMRVDDRRFEPEQAPADPRDIEQVVDQADLKRDVPADHLAEVANLGA